MNAPHQVPGGSIGAQWLYHVRHASRRYWLAQATLLSLYLGFSSAMVLGLTPVDGAPPRHSGQTVARMAMDILLLAAILHLAVRPALLIFYTHRRVRIAHVLAGVGALAVLGLMQVWLGLLLGRLLTPRDGLNFEQIRFHAGETAYDFEIGTASLLLLGGFNQFALLLLWSLLYLAWKAFESRRQLQQQVREARLRQLTHQLSPHFLFNAFNSIRGMIFEDRERAADLVTQLSELFRFHLSSEVRTQVSLAEDWEIARRYLDIEAVRLESRMRLDVDLPPALMERKLPTLTLLTLVENAIKHGIAPNREGGVLQVRARALDAGWRLEVANSVGRGIAEYSGGHGLSNLRERLALTRGDDDGIDIERGDGRFAVRMEFGR